MASIVGESRPYIRPEYVSDIIKPIGVDFFRLIGEEYKQASEPEKVATLLLRGYKKDTILRRCFKENGRNSSNVQAVFKKAHNIIKENYDNGDGLEAKECLRLGRAYGRLAKEFLGNDYAKSDAEEIVMDFLENCDYKSAKKVMNRGDIKSENFLQTCDDLILSGENSRNYPKIKNYFLNESVEDLKKSRTASLNRRIEKEREKYGLKIRPLIEEMRNLEYKMYDTRILKSFKPERRLRKKLMLDRKRIKKSLKIKEMEFFDKERKLNKRIFQMQEHSRILLNSDAKERYGCKYNLFLRDILNSDKKSSQFNDQLILNREEGTGFSKEFRKYLKGKAIGFLEEGETEKAMEIYKQLSNQRAMKRLTKDLNKTYWNQKFSSEVFLKRKERRRNLTKAGLSALAGGVIGGIIGSIFGDSFPDYNHARSLASAGSLTGLMAYVFSQAGKESDYKLKPNSP